MRTASIREVRQNLTSLLDDVRKGREVVITERRRAVARIVPVQQRQPFPDLSEYRRQFSALGVSLSQAIIDEREESV
jgi:prevent-host-death family protein